MTEEEITGKPPRIRKLEFLIAFYRQEQKPFNMGQDEYWRYDTLINALRNEYLFLAKKPYEEPRGEQDANN